MPIEPRPKRQKFRQETVIHSYLTRPLAQEIVLLLWNTSITANQITFFRVVLNIISLALFLSANHLLILIGFILFQIHELLDAADGLLARWKGQTSKIGEFAEKFFDEIFSTGFGLMGFVIALSAEIISGDSIYIYVYIASAIGKLISSSFGHYFPEPENEPTENAEPHYYALLGVPFKKAIKNLVTTVYIWQNQMLLWGLLFFEEFLAQGVDLLLIGFGVSAILNHIVWIDKSYRVFRALDRSGK